jgi:hypothetical protein
MGGNQMQSLSLKKLFYTTMVAGLLMTITTSITIADGNDFVYGELRVDLPEIYNAKDYQVDLLAEAGPSNSSNGYTTAWLSIHLDNQAGTFGQKFTQVGLLTDQNGVYWFVYSEAGVSCLQGSVFWRDNNQVPIGCRGNLYHWVSINTWHTVELVKYSTNSYWIARVYDADGHGLDMAAIFSSNTRIYRANSTTEEAYLGSTDPNMQAKFHHHEPRYKNVDTFTSFQLWPRSNGNNSRIYTTAINTPLPICPNKYGATPNIDNYEYKWFAGTGGQICNWILFPAFHHYLPLTMK